MTQKPIIFLAYANDKTEKGVYLRNLSKEMHAIRDALCDAERSGLCEIIERSSATISDIVDVLQDPQNSARISIFHYAGHADSESLLLETLDGGHSQAFKDGLVPILARQESLKLVFINGCSSEGQTNDLFDAGVPAVIGTTQSINDEIATLLAARFYKGIAQGEGIEKAWQDAVDEIKITTGGDTRGLHQAEQIPKTASASWQIRFASGANSARDWNLPEAANNPLFGLPEPASTALPESPFTYLSHYKQQDASVFFGREKSIRELYSMVTDAVAPPLVLLYGQSGVGKTSLLQAGLAARAERSMEVLLLTRNDSLGLSDTLYMALLERCGFQTSQDAGSTAPRPPDRSLIAALEALEKSIDTELRPDLLSLIDKVRSKYLSANGHRAAVQPADLLEAWHMKEELSGQPLLIVLDQFEEVFTRPNPKLSNEIAALLANLKSIFQSPHARPGGKVVLSYRKEYHPDVEELCKSSNISRSRVFLDHLTREEIVSVFTGLTTRPGLKAAYNLQLEANLADLIASDNTRDASESPAGPAFQIVLTQMWDRAQKVAAGKPVFTNSLYTDYRDKGMEKFLQQQLERLETQFPEEVASGLAVDVLHMHCTKNNTCGLCTEKDLQSCYSYPPEKTVRLVQRCKELFLLVDASGNNATTLAHDALAIVVSRLYQSSARVVQQASRILLAKGEALDAGVKDIVLDQYELGIVEKATGFMRHLTVEEGALVERSRAAARHKLWAEKRLRYTRIAIIAVSVLATIIVSALCVLSWRQEEKSFMIARAAASMFYLDRDNTRSLLAAIEGYESAGDARALPELKNDIVSSFYTAVDSNTPYYRLLINGNKGILGALYSFEHQYFIPLPQEGVAKVYDFDGHEICSLSADGVSDDKTFQLLYRSALSSDKMYIMGLGTDSTLRIWNRAGVRINQSDVGKHIWYFQASPVKDQYLTVAGGAISLRDISGGLLASIPLQYDFRHIEFNPSGSRLCIIYRDHPPVLVTLDSSRIISVDGRNAAALGCTFSHNGNSLLISYPDSTLTLCDSNGLALHHFPRQSAPIFHTAFSPTDSLFVICAGKDANLYGTAGFSTSFTFHHDDQVTYAKFSHTGAHMLTSSADNVAFVWSLTDLTRKRLLGHLNDVTSGFFSKDEKTVYTTSLDGSIRMWDLEMYRPPRLSGHTGPVLLLRMLNERNICSAGADSTLIVWDVLSHSIASSVKLKEGILQLQVSQDGDKVLLLGSTGHAMLWDWETKMQPQFQRGQRGHVRYTGFLENDSSVAISDDGTMRLMDHTGNCYKTMRLRDSACGLAIAQAGGRVAIPAKSGKIYLYSTRTGRLDSLAGRHRGGAVTKCAISPNGRYLVASTEDNTVTGWELGATVSRPKEFGSPLQAPYFKMTINSIRFSPDSKHIITACSDRVARVWKTDGSLQTILNGHFASVTDGVFFGDEKIYTISEDGTVRYWTLNGIEIAQYSCKKEHINAVVADNAAKQMFIATSDPAIHIWLTAIGIVDQMKAPGSVYQYYRQHAERYGY